jgi:hypothetical protein
LNCGDCGRASRGLRRSDSRTRVYIHHWPKAPRQYRLDFRQRAAFPRQLRQMIGDLTQKLARRSTGDCFSWRFIRPSLLAEPPDRSSPNSPIPHRQSAIRAHRYTQRDPEPRCSCMLDISSTATALGGSRPRANRPMGPFPTCPYKTLYTPHTPSSGFPPLTARRPIPSTPTTKMTTGQKVLDARYDVSLPPARLAVSRRTSS